MRIVMQLRSAPCTSLRSFNIGTTVVGETPKKALNLVMFVSSLTLCCLFELKPQHNKPTWRTSTSVIVLMIAYLLCFLLLSSCWEVATREGGNGPAATLRERCCAVVLWVRRSALFSLLRELISFSRASSFSFRLSFSLRSPLMLLGGLFPSVVALPLSLRTCVLLDLICTIV